MGENIKIIIIGQTNAGKTTFLTKLMQGMSSNQWDQYVSVNNIYPTIGMSFSTKTVIYDNNKYTLNFWDTAGQERYLSICDNYYRNAQYCFLVFDSTDRLSFDTVLIWKDKCDNANIDKLPHYILVGNKIDKGGPRPISDIELEQYCSDNNIDEYYLVSSQFGTGMEYLYKNFIKKVNDNNHKTLYISPLEIETPIQPSSSCC